MTPLEAHGTHTTVDRIPQRNRVNYIALSTDGCVPPNSCATPPDLRWRSKSLSVTFAVCAIALLVEALAGYPASLFGAIGHPVTWMGRMIAWLDLRLNHDSDGFERRRTAGVAAIVALLAAVGFAALLLQVAVTALLPPAAAILVLGVAASSCLAQRSLDQHVRAVAEAPDRDGLDAGRRRVGLIVGRDTAALDATGVARAAIESLSENFADGIVAPAVWLALGGLPGGVVYKAINTADSMIGHRTPRHAAFGFAAAKLDDLVNGPAARLAALWLVAAAALLPDASGADAWRIMRRDARGHPSPNAGWPEAAMAGALGLRLGGPRAYAGRAVADAFIGDGDGIAGAAAIQRALRVYRLACGLQIGATVVAAMVIARG